MKDNKQRTITSATAAKMLGINPSRVRQIARQYDIGELVAPRCRLFSASEVKLLEKHRGRVGNPNFGKKPTTVAD